MTEDRWVYFIRAGKAGPIKIGSASDPEKRIRVLQTAHWEKILLMGVCSGGYRKERALHEELASHRIRGEWFRPAYQVLEVVTRCLGEHDEEAFVSPPAGFAHRDLEGLTPQVMSLGGTRIEMVRTKHCRVCRSPYRPLIDEQISVGLSLRRIKELLPEDCNLSYSSLSRHRYAVLAES